MVGSDSLHNEVELLSLIDFVMERLGINALIKVNNRKVLTGIAQVLGAEDKIVDITVAIDKIDKVGLENVNKELLEKGLSQEAVARLEPILTLTGTTEEKLARLSEILAGSEEGLKGIAELREVLDGVAALGGEAEVELDVSLARGLNYYTGTIIEVKAKDVAIGSITGGGRYDNLTGVFGMPGLSGVGISFGADRIYDVLNQLDLYPAEISAAVKVLFINFGEAEARMAEKTIASLRRAGISAQLYPDAAKMKKQMNYANAEGVAYVAIIGEDELASGTVTLKDMSTGEQQRLTPAELVEALR